MGKLFRGFSVLVLIITIINTPLTTEKSVYATQGKISLGFEPFDTVIDPNRTVVYMTEKNSKTIYSVNYVTGEIKTLLLPYSSEKIEMYNDKLYVTQVKVPHSYHNYGPYSGGIAEVDPVNFSITSMMNIEADPYDIAIDKDGYIYVTPGSGQHEYIKVYSLKDKTEVVNDFIARMGDRSSIVYNPTTNKLYTITSDSFPRDVLAFEVDKGIIKSKYDSPYHGEYELSILSKISPDGLRMYFNTGVVLGLSSTRTGDMSFKFKMHEFQEDEEYPYTDYEFSANDQLTFVSNSLGGIDVFRYDSNEYLYTIKRDCYIEKMHFKSGLITIQTNDYGDYFVEYIIDYKQNPFSITDSSYRAYGKNGIFFDDFYNNKNGIPTSSAFIIQLNQQVNILDSSKITLLGPDGVVKLNIEADKGILCIQPEYLRDLSDYTLHIGEDAITGYLNEKKLGGFTIKFKTAVPALTSLNIAVDNSEAPKQYTFKAQASGGHEPLYRFLISENSEWKVIQNYSTNTDLIWSTRKNGTYRFRLQVKSAESSAEYDEYIDFNQHVNDNILPSVNLVQDKTFSTNEDVTININASDNVGIESIKLPNGTIINNSETKITVSENGVYNFEVKDLFGNITSKALNIDIIDKLNPEVTLIQSTKEPTKENVLLVISAYDNTNVKSITLPNGEIVNGDNAYYSISSNGTYKISVEDFAGNKTIKSINITNIYKRNINTPSVEPVADNHIAISGNTKPNYIVNAKNGGTVIGTTRATSTGYYSIPISKQKAFSIISVYSKDPAGNLSIPMVLGVSDKTAPDAPFVKPIWDNHVVITGKTEPNVIVYAYNGTKLLNQVESSTTGYYNLFITKQVAGIKISVFSKDFSSNVSNPRVITVLDKTPPQVPSVNPIWDNHLNITGKATPNTTLIVKNGSLSLGAVKSSSTGYYKLNIKKQSAGSKIYVYAKDSAGNLSIAKIVTVLDKTPPSAPKVNKLYSYSTVITGTAEKGTRVYVYNGRKYLNSGVVGSTGKFIIKIPKQKKKINLSLFTVDKVKLRSKTSFVRVY